VWSVGSTVQVGPVGFERLDAAVSQSVAEPATDAGLAG
jgi:hypothetical protein